MMAMAVASTIWDNVGRRRVDAIISHPTKCLIVRCRLIGILRLGVWNFSRHRKATSTYTYIYRVCKMDWRHFEGLNTYSPWLQLFKYQKVKIFQIMNMMMGEKVSCAHQRYEVL